MFFNVYVYGLIEGLSLAPPIILKQSSSLPTYKNKFVIKTAKKKVI